MPEIILFDKKGNQVIKQHMIDVREAIESGNYFLRNPLEKKADDPDPRKIEPDELKEVVLSKETPEDTESEAEKARKARLEKSLKEKGIVPGKVVTHEKRLTPAK